jgi:large subunit ribosomal protein L22
MTYRDFTNSDDSATFASGSGATLHHYRMSAFKVRPVLDLIRGKEVSKAKDLLHYCDREAARVISRVLNSAISNAENNDNLNADELYVSECFCDEAATLKRWRPRARGRAGRIRKRASHITVVVDRLDDEKLKLLHAAQQAATSRSLRARRVAATKKTEAEASFHGSSGSDLASDKKVVTTETNEGAIRLGEDEEVLEDVTKETDEGTTETDEGTEAAKESKEEPHGSKG